MADYTRLGRRPAFQAGLPFFDLGDYNAAVGIDLFTSSLGERPTRLSSTRPAGPAISRLCRHDPFSGTRYLASSTFIVSDARPSSLNVSRTVVSATQPADAKQSARPCRIPADRRHG